MADGLAQLEAIATTWWYICWPLVLAAAALGLGALVKYLLDRRQR